MSLPVWKSELPQVFQQDGYSENEINNIVATQMDSGAIKRRPKKARGYKEIAGKMHLSLGQKVIFENFYKNDIKYKALPFTMPTYGGVTMDCLLDSYSLVPKSGLQWELTMKLKVLV